ncbi:ABC transporter substrate-binding protein [Ramlibacter alkalitolerans]|uniref:ABC transporter substrate-binding protein n=1 Tax=Ramlibacter alkalitolerans TaxID=2039631 RepID=A0ABS1JM64_9BURK|nr:ABC transporter substrate-binding protein [Ramlibacter alkalitolerans]MBL0425342.1 ABC transporter substrate-binding protein [Ramlibacter alkalitolerans]
MKPWLAALALACSAVHAQGTVNAICSTDQSWCELAAQEFSKATGIRVLQTRKPTGEALAQIRAEAANPKTDLWWGGTGDPFYQAAEAGLLEPYRPGYLDDLHGWAVRQYAMSQNRVGGFYTSAIGFGWNAEVLRKRKLPPKCWKDLLDPRYKGEIETSHPGSSGTGYTILAGLVQLMGEDAAFDYLKKLHRNVSQYTRSGTAQARSVAKGEVAIGVSFIFGFDNERLTNRFPVFAAAPCEGTPYEIGGIALIHGARNPAEAKRYYDWLMSPAGQQIGARANSLQVPANKTFKPDPRIPTLENVRLIQYDFEKFGKAAERRRLVERWVREVEALPR